MNSEQTCPLCKDKLIYSNVQYRCNKIKCYFFGNRIHSHEIDLINAQISRIKQEAKQELWDEINGSELSLEPCCNKTDKDICTSCIDFYRIKKKHGVE